MSCSQLKERKQAGFTLLEVMLALVILAVIAVGITRSLIMTRGLAETNIRESSAVAAASGYLEQMKSMEYERILTSVRDPDVPIPTVLAEGQPDPLFLDQWMEKELVIDQDAQTGQERTMPLWVRLEVQDLEPSNNGSLMAITLFFAWEDAKTGQRRDRSVRTMRSLVPTFY